MSFTNPEPHDPRGVATGSNRYVWAPVWQDSLELLGALWWTPGFRERFEGIHGYDCTRYLPLYFSRSNRFAQIDAPYRTEFVLGNYTIDGGSEGSRYVRDYQTTLTEAYADSLGWFADWAETKGMRHSAQPAYNLPMEMVRVPSRAPRSRQNTCS